MAADLSITEQVERIMPSIYSEKIAVLNNFGYEGLQHMMESIGRCDCFFNIVSVRLNHLLSRHVAQFFYSFALVNADAELVTFHLKVEGVPDIPIPVLPLVL